MTPQELVDEIEQLVALPDICVKVNRLIDAPNYSAATLGDLVSQDTDISARLLRLVNSAFFNLQAPVETISRAVTVVGTSELRNLIMATAATRVFTGIPSDLVDMAEFWRYSLTSGVIAGELASRCRVLHTERLFVMGVLHDIGRLAIYLKLPDDSRDILLIAGGDDTLLPEVEDDILGFNHMQVGEALLHKWRLPQSIATVVAYHHHPFQAREFGLESALIHLATVFANREIIQESLEEAIERVDPFAWVITGLKQDSIAAILDQVPAKVNEIIDVVLSPKLSSARQHHS
jgi:HD-like signal output (HDOD) protein